MAESKSEMKRHEAQEPHTAEECRINEAPHNHPDTDCGHFVNEGPGVAAKTAHSDLNIYGSDKHDSHHIVAGGPRHNMDQDPEHGPGMQ